MTRPIPIDLLAGAANDDGIDRAVQCSDCVSLCCRLTVVLKPEDRVPAGLTARLQNGVAVMARGADGYCVALSGDHRGCTIYDARPGDCRRFRMGGAYCRSERRNHRLTTPAA
jgi:uncharacterized protein